MEEIPRQPNIDSVIWLLIMQIYNGKEKEEQKEIQNIQFEEENSNRKRNGAPRFMLKEITRLR